MGSFVSNIIGSFLIFCCLINIWSRLLDKKVNYKSFKFYFVILCGLILILINYFYNYVYLRMIIIVFCFAFLNYFLFRSDLKNTIISTVFSQLIFSVSDMVFGLIIIYILKIDFNSLNDFSGTLFVNVFVCILSIILSRFRFVKNSYVSLIRIIDYVGSKKVILLAFLIILSLNFLLALIYFKLNIYYVFGINIFFVVVYSYVIIRSLETTSKNNVFKMQNMSLMESLRQYEDMVDRQRVDNHENKNQLLIIKNMIKKKDKDIVKYIDTVVKNQMEDDESLYTRVMTIPSGGLQGIIYQKMLVMKDEHIKFSLDVGRDVRNFELDKLSMDDNYRLCKIIGVFLDNAIEESRNIIDKCIMISLYVDNGNLVIGVSNKFSGKIDIDRIDDSGYTTKGDGHGYGLSLVKKILSETNVFENERSINRNVFKQIIRIKNTQINF